MSTSAISNVSDTARWVAVYRARESARPDALFHDPFAQALAGERGEAIAALMPRQARSGWPLITRTKVMDEMILERIAQGCDCVVNLAAGFDTRPYRLAIPASLRWIEADLPALIEEKEQLLVEAYVDDNRNLPDMFVLRFRDANRRNLLANDRVNKVWSLFSPTVSLLTEIGLLTVWAFGIEPRNRSLEEMRADDAGVPVLKQVS